MLLGENRQLARDKVALEGEKAQAERRVGEALARHAVSHRELSMVSRERIGDGALAAKLLSRNLSIHQSTLNGSTDRNASTLLNASTCAHARDASCASTATPALHDAGAATTRSDAGGAGAGAGLGLSEGQLLRERLLAQLRESRDAPATPASAAGRPPLPRAAGGGTDS